MDNPVADNDRKVGTPGDLHFDTNAAAGGPVVDLTEEEEEPPENPMDVVSENTEVPADSEAPKTASPPAISPTNNRSYKIYCLACVDDENSEVNLIFVILRDNRRTSYRNDLQRGENM